MGFLKAESSDWQGARPGRVPTRRCGDVSLPSEAQGLGLAGKGQGVESRLAGLEEGGPGSSQRCLKDHKSKTNSWHKRSFHRLNCMVEFLPLLFLFIHVLPPLSSVPGRGAQDAGGALVGPSL